MDAREAEFRALFEEHYGAVIRYAQRRIEDAEVARELAGECFTIAWQKFDTARPFDLPWLFQTTRYLLSNEFRRHAREAEVLRRVAEVPDEHGEWDDAIEMRIALARLTTSERELVLLSYWEGLSAVEIASVLGITNGAVRVRLSRARAHLRELLDGTRGTGRAEMRLADDLG